MKRFLTTAFILLGLFSTSAIADSKGDSYVCKHGDKTRTITIMYRYAGDPTPCEVLYEKDSGTQTLWNAQAEAGYCERKTKEFIDKQEGWGWNCTLEEANKS